MTEKFVYYLTCNLTEHQFNLIIRKYPLLREGDKTVFYDSGVGGDMRMYKSELMTLSSYNRTISLHNLQYTLYCLDETLEEGKKLVQEAILKRVNEIELELKNAQKLIKKVDIKIC